jgi:hypothetical protein
MVGEAVFAPRVGGTDEADGYMIMQAYNQPTDKSELMVSKLPQLTRDRLLQLKYQLEFLRVFTAVGSRHNRRSDLDRRGTALY